MATTRSRSARSASWGSAGTTARSTARWRRSSWPRSSGGSRAGTDAVDQRVSLITLGVQDLARARAFYEAIGWTTRAAPGDDVCFFQAGGLVVALWDRAQLAEDSGVPDPGGWGGI